MSKVFDMPLAQIYPLYVAKLARKGRDATDLDTVITWLTGYEKPAVEAHIEAGSSLAEFFNQAEINPAAKLITGSICGVKVQEIQDPLMWKIRCLDKVVDELAKGWPLEKILRTQP